MSQRTEETRMAGEGAVAANKVAPAEQVVAEETGVAARLAAIEARLAALEPRTVSNKATFFVFSGDLDKTLSSLALATGAAAMGLEVKLFYALWGVSTLRKGRKFEDKTLVEKALSAMMPGGFDDLPASRLPFAGVGTKLLRAQMKAKNVSIHELFAHARELGVQFWACELAMDLVGITRDELVDGVQVAGIAAFLAEAADSKISLFI